MRAWVAVLILAIASPAAAHPCPGDKPKVAKKPTPATTPTASPTAEQVMKLYVTTGKALAAIRNNAAADSLFMRYRLININDAIVSATKRADAVATLDKINADIKRLVP